MENPIEKWQSIINALEKRVFKLEEFYKCETCKKIDVLFHCYECQERNCNSCSIKLHTKTYKGDVCLYYCKTCYV